jgi:hypothetical protein
MKILEHASVKVMVWDDASDMGMDGPTYQPDLSGSELIFFGLGVRETRERVRVGRALRTLPRIEQAFIHGELSYSRAREFTRVATAQTESDWLALAQTLDMRAFERRVAGARAAQVSADGVGEVTADAERARQNALAELQNGARQL